MKSLIVLLFIFLPYGLYAQTDHGNMVMPEQKAVLDPGVGNVF